MGCTDGTYVIGATSETEKYREIRLTSSRKLTSWKINSLNFQIFNIKYLDKSNSRTRFLPR